MKALFNIKKLQVAKLTETDGEYSYDTPIKVKGTVSLSMDVEQSNEVIYADGGAYITLQGAATTTGTLENYHIPEEVLLKIYNYIKGTNGEICQTDEAVSRMAMQFACDDDEGNEVYFTYYDVVSTKPSLNLQTREDGVTVNAESVDLTANPITIDGKNIIRSYATKDTDAYANYFDKVTLPTFTTV